MKYDSEQDYVDNLKYTLENLGYSVWTEVVPDQCINWEQPQRVDLVFWHPKIGYIGVEAKNIRTLRQGSVFAELEYKKDDWSPNKNIFCEQCGASLDIEDDICPYCNKKKRDILW